MKHMNVVQLRQSVGKAVAALEKNGEPIILDKGRRSVAVLISLQDFEERFVENAAALAHEQEAFGLTANEKACKKVKTSHFLALSDWK